MKSFTERIIELIQEDQELHDSVIRLITATAAEKELKTSMLKKRRRSIKTEDILKV